MSKFKLEFVSYDASQFAWCLGTLVLLVNGRKAIFDSDFVVGGHYPRFWRSGGTLGSSDDASAGADITTGPWEVLELRLPKRWRRHAQEFGDIMNKNVKPGCCGGCL